MQEMMNPKNTSIIRHVKEGKIVLGFVQKKKHAWTTNFLIEDVFDIFLITKNWIANNIGSLKKLGLYEVRPWFRGVNWAHNWIY